MVDEEVFDIDNFVGEDQWDDGAPAQFFYLSRRFYEVGRIHYVEYDSGFEDNSDDEDDHSDYDSGFDSV